jgi:GGDEF domain-containing protein
MLHTPLASQTPRHAVDSPATAPVERRAPPPPRAAPPALVLELADAHAFRRQAERDALHCRRAGEVLSVLCLRAQFSASTPPGLQSDLLAECARRLRSRVRRTDTVARWHQTQFGVLLFRCDGAQAQAVLQRLTDVAGGHYRLDSQLLKLEVIGQVAPLQHLR